MKKMPLLARSLAAVQEIAMLKAGGENSNGKKFLPE